MSGSPDLSQAEATILQWLADCAACGNPCPTNNEIAERIGARSSSSAARVVSRLEALGHITVQRTRVSRIVKINATGGMTFKVPHKRRKSFIPRAAVAVPRRVEHIAAPPPVIDRDPCFLCGTRGDIGCSHRRAA